MNKYLRAISANYIFFVVQTIAFLVLTGVALRVMGEEFFGVWSILNSILVFSSGILSLSVVMNKFISEANTELSPDSILTAGYLILIPIALVVVTILILIRTWISSQFDLSIQVEANFRVALIFIALSVLPQFLSRIPQGFLLAHLKNQEVRAVDLFFNVILFWGGAIYFAFSTSNIILMVLWVFFVQSARFFVLNKLVSKMIAWKWKYNLRVVKKVFNFSIYSFLENIAIALFQQFDRILVGFVLGPASSGVYAISTSVGLRQTMVVGQSTEVMIPYASLKQAKNKRSELYKTYRKLVRFVSLVIAALSTFLIIWMPEILTLWLSPVYADKYSFMFRVVVLNYGLFTLSHPGRQTLMGTGRVKFVAILYFLASLFMLSVLFFLSKEFGIIGAALANSAIISLNILNVFAYKSVLGKIRWSHILGDMWIGFLLPILIFIIMLNIELSLSSKSIINLAIFSLLLTLFFRSMREIKAFIDKVL